LAATLLAGVDGGRGARCEKRLFCAPCHAKIEYVPRQARDKHREKLKKTHVSAGVWFDICAGEFEKKIRDRRQQQQAQQQQGREQKPRSDGRQHAQGDAGKKGQEAQATALERGRACRVFDWRWVKGRVRKMAF